MSEPRVWRRGWLAVALLAICLAANQANACTLDDDYKGPETNFELVQKADVILVGTMVKSVGGHGSYEILVKPTLLLKGRELPDSIVIDGALSDRPINVGENRWVIAYATESDHADLWRAHPVSFSGSCNRYTFDPGMQVVLFLQKDGSGLRRFNPPFMRDAEDVPSHDALWVKAVQLYVRISKLPADQQKAALRREMLALRSSKSHIGYWESILLADDIERQLLGCATADSLFPIEERCANISWAQNISDASFVRMPKYVDSDPPSAWRDFLAWLSWKTVAIIALVANALLALGHIVVWRKRSISH